MTNLLPSKVKRFNFRKTAKGAQSAQCHAEMNELLACWRANGVDNLNQKAGRLFNDYGKMF
jgi:hypothetical protein